MDQFFASIQSYFPILAQYKYLLLFLASLIEGFNVFILTGFLVSIGTFSLLPAFGVSLAGELVNSYFWYAVGYWGGAKPIDFFIRKSPKKRRLVEKIRGYLQQYTGRILLLMKLTYSITIVTIILIGSIKYSLKKFSLINFIGSIGWVTITLSIGYFFGKSFQLYRTYFENISYAIIFVLAAIALIYAIERASRAIFVKAINLADRLKAVGEKVRDGIDRVLSDD